MSTIVICGISYELTNEPIHGVVRALRDRQKTITFDFLFTNKDLFEENPKMGLDEAINLIATRRPSEMAKYSSQLEEFEGIGTLSLATGHLFTEDELFNLKEKEFKEIYDKCCEVLGGGGMKYFFGESKMSISSVAKEPMTKMKPGPKPSQSQSKK